MNNAVKFDVCLELVQNLEMRKVTSKMVYFSIQRFYGNIKLLILKDRGTKGAFS